MARIFKRTVISNSTGYKTEGKFWWISYTQYGRQEKRSLGVTDRKLAEIMMVEVVRNIEREKAALPQSFVDVYELFQEYKLSVIKKKSPEYQKRMFQLLKPFLIYVRDEKHLNLARVMTREIEQFMNDQRGYLSSSSWNHELREIRRLIGFAIDRQYLFQNPAAKVTLRRPVQYSAEVFTPEELNLIFKHAHRPSVPFYKMLLYTGLRNGELRNLCWSDVDLAPGKEHVKIRNTPLHLTKTRKDRVVPLCAEAVAIMHKLRVERDPNSTYVFPGRKGRHRGGNRNTWANCLKRIEAKTGVKIDRGPYRTGLHLFRHTFATYALASGVDLRTVQDWLGHSTILMTQRYTNLLPNQKHEQIQKLTFRSTEPGETEAKERFILTQTEGVIHENATYS